MNPEKALKLKQKAEELFQQEKYDKALETIVKSLEEHPENPIAWQLQGLIQEACGFKNESLASFKEALARDTNCEMAYIGIARVHRARKDFFKAFQTLADITKRDPASKNLRQFVLDILENDNAAEWEELFKTQPEIMVKLVQNAGNDIDFKYKMTGVLKNVAVAKPELFQGKALDIINELAKSSDDEIRSTAYVLLVAAYEASPTIIENHKHMLKSGVKDSNNYVQKSTGGIIKSMIDYFANFLVGEEELLTQALENPLIAEILLKTLPVCPNCRDQEHLYLQKVIDGEKILRMYCEKCDTKFYRQPGARTVQVMDKTEQRMKGPVVCPECKMQYLIFSDADKMYSCSVCRKWYTH
jgi:tetratricopeptide (TPR) repeat protein